MLVVPDNLYHGCAAWICHLPPRSVLVGDLAWRIVCVWLTWRLIPHSLILRDCLLLGYTPQGGVRPRSCLIFCICVSLVCCLFPLYGIITSKSADPLHRMWVVLASSRGTLNELGLSPAITSGMMMQMLAGSRIIEENQSLKDECARLAGAQKFVWMLIPMGEAVL